MAKIKYTKGELKRQRDSLKQFMHYLPTLQLKKQQLQLKILEARRVISQKQKALDELTKNINPWAGLLADPRIDITPWVTPKKVLTATVNIAGANIPVFTGIEFENRNYEYYSTPLWIDEGITRVQELVKVVVEIQLLHRQIEILAEELRVTTQRVNLFEKIKIPECIENIRRIRIYLGDQMANAVGIGKVAKKKIEAREEMFA